MLSLFINHDCIACDACAEVCPTNAISVDDPIYIINPDKCIMCNGYSDNPYCINVCPMDSIQYLDSTKKTS